MERNRTAGGELIVGRLVEHGPAKYQFREDAALSYFLKLQTTEGMRVVWGKDLPRALAFSETKAKVGDMVGVRRLGREAVTVIDQQRDSEGKVVAQREHAAHRNQWKVERAEYFVERARRARTLRDEQEYWRSIAAAGPDMSSTVPILRAAADFAEGRISHPEDRRRFVELVREVLERSTQAGQSVPRVPAEKHEDGERRIQPGRGRTR